MRHPLLTTKGTRPGLAPTLVVLGLIPLFGGCPGKKPDPGCQDPCPQVDALRCGGSAIQRCTLGADACLGWVLVEDCAASQRVCLDPGTGPICGVICTDQCSLAQTRCDGPAVQGCAPNSDGCLRWVEAVDCSDATQICALTGGDATCVAQ